MITHSTTREGYLIPSIQGSCALVGAAFLVVCISSGLLKYISFTGTVTAGVMGAGLVSVAIEDCRRCKVKVTTQPADPIECFRRVAQKTSELISFKCGISGKIRICGDRAVIRTSAGHWVSNKDISQLEKGEDLLLVSDGFIQVRGGYVERYQWGNPEWVWSLYHGFMYSFAYDEAQGFLYVVTGGGLVKYNGSTQVEVSQEEIENLLKVVVDGAGRQCYIIGADWSPSSVRYEGQNFALPKDVRSYSLKIEDEKLFYETADKLAMLDLKTGETTPLLDKYRIDHFDVQGDLIVFSGVLATDRDARIHKIYNFKTGAEVDLTSAFPNLGRLLDLQFCGPKDIAFAHFARGATEGVNVTWLTYA